MSSSPRSVHKAHHHHGHGQQVHKKSLLEGVDLLHPIHKGYMYKQSHLHKAFNKRYFALYDRIMVYYETENEFYRDASRGNFEHRHRAIRLDGVYLTKPDKKPKGARFCFILHCPDKLNEKSEYLLVTDTRDERRQWMDLLQKQNSKLIDTHESQSGSTLQVPGAARKIRADSATPETMEQMTEAFKNGHDDTSSHHELDIRDDRSDIVDMETSPPS